LGKTCGACACAHVITNAAMSNPPYSKKLANQRFFGKEPLVRRNVKILIPF